MVDMGVERVATDNFVRCRSRSSILPMNGFFVGPSPWHPKAVRTLTFMLQGAGVALELKGVRRDGPPLPGPGLDLPLVTTFIKPGPSVYAYR